MSAFRPERRVRDRCSCQSISGSSMSSTKVFPQILTLSDYTPSNHLTILSSQAGQPGQTDIDRWPGRATGAISFLAGMLARGYPVLTEEQPLFPPCAYASGSSAPSCLTSALPCRCLVSRQGPSCRHPASRRACSSYPPFAPSFRSSVLSAQESWGSLEPVGHILYDACICIIEPLLGPMPPCLFCPHHGASAAPLRPRRHDQSYQNHHHHYTSNLHGHSPFAKGCENIACHCLSRLPLNMCRTYPEKTWKYCTCSGAAQSPQLPCFPVHRSPLFSSFSRVRSRRRRP